MSLARRFLPGVPHRKAHMDRQVRLRRRQMNVQIVRRESERTTLRIRNRYDRLFRRSLRRLLDRPESSDPR